MRCRFPFPWHASGPSFVPQAWPASAAAKISEKGGMNLSSRVWNLNDNSRKELETIIQNGIIEGKSPHEVSRDLRKYLNNPEALFRRVRNPKTGDLELGKAAKKYHPGQGVYRSAYKNERRLAVTEMNAAYRRAQWESYQKNPLVTAYEIRLSANHTTTIKGKIVPLEDICDQLAGRYPKTFLWTGWHPHCRCDMIPVLLTEEDFKARIQARAKGKLGTWEKEYKKAHPDPTYPKGMTDWIKNNTERIKSGGKLPDWVDGNKVSMIKEANREDYKRFSGDANYKDVAFDETSGGIKATHVGHNFDHLKGDYEKTVQDVGYKNGHSVIFGEEPQNMYKNRSCEGEWDNLPFEVAGAENATESNIRNALKHCAAKPDTQIAVLFFPNGNFSSENFNAGYAMFNGLKGTSQYKKFQLIYCIQGNNIVQIKKPD